MPLEGHWERQNTPLRAAGRRELRFLWALVGVLAAGVVVAAVIALTSHATLRAGCIEVGTPSTTGGAQVHACGTQAAQYCRAEKLRTAGAATETADRCRRAGYP